MIKLKQNKFIIDYHILSAILISFLIFTTTCFADLIVNENGNVGIGTTGPALKLEVYGTNGEPATSGTTQIGTARFRGSITNVMDFGSYGAFPWGAWIQVTDSANLALKYPLTLQPNGGNVGIGTITPGSKLEVGTNTMFSGKLIRALGYSSDDGDANIEIGDGSAVYWRLRRTESNQFRTVMSQSWTITGGNVIAAVYSPSDIRWKTNINTIENSLEKVSQLRGVTYEWIDPSKGVGNQIGVIAQEVEEVFPEAVSTDDQGYKSVAYAKLVGPLIEAIKDLKNEIEILKIQNAEIEVIKAENKQLIDRILLIEQTLSKTKH